MSDAPAWAALALSVLNTGYLGYRSYRGRKHAQAAGPVAEIRPALVAAQEGFQHIVTESGVYSDWFLADPRPLRAEPLEDLAKRTADDDLAERIRRLAAHCRECFALAPSKPGPRIYSFGGGSDSYPDYYAQEDTEIRHKTAQLVEAARDGLQQAEAAVNRLNVLEARL